jgi:hypothetical protein
VGCYTYHGTKIHAVTAAGGLSFSYDANGNLTTRSGASVTWYASNQPQTISNGSYSSTFEYGPNRHYWKQTATYSNGTETTRYVGGLLEIVQGPSVTSWRHQILAAAGRWRSTRAAAMARTTRSIRCAITSAAPRRSRTPAARSS